MTRIKHIRPTPLLFLVPFLATIVTGGATTSNSKNVNNDNHWRGGTYFNFEVEKRVLERLDFYLGGPVGVNEMIHNFRSNDGFPNDMLAADLTEYLSLAYSVSQPLVYFGLEDGTCLG